MRCLRHDRPAGVYESRVSLPELRDADERDGPDRSPARVVSASNHSYTTPHGKLIAQVQANGTWRAAVSLTPAAGKSDATAILVKNLLSSWAKLNDAGLPRLHSFAAKELCCTWALPGSAGFVPLAARRPPLESAEVKKLIIALAEPLEPAPSAGAGRL